MVENCKVPKLTGKYYSQKTCSAFARVELIFILANYIGAMF